MAVTSGFFNSLYGDRKYTAEQFSAIFDGVINDGVFSNIGTAFRVSAATDNMISIGIGRAWFNGIWINNDAILPMTCNDPEVLLDRIDAVVIEINRSEAVRAGRIIFVKGTASGTPVNPTLTHDEGVDQYPLAYIRRKAGVSEVVQADITNCIGTSECPYVTGILETQNIDSIVAQWESEFNLWFDGLQTELEGDVAANLASQIISLDMRFDELAKTRTVTVELEDSSLDTIEDSTGAAIYGSTVLESEGSGTIVVEPTKEPEEVDGFEVGDILTTTRDSIFEDDRWVLCNGSSLNGEEYGELKSVTHKSPAFPWKIQAIGNYEADIQGGTRVVYGDGYYVVAFGSFNGNQIIIAYKQKINAGWTKIVLPSITGAGAYDMVYANGYFVIAGSYSNCTKTAIWYATDPTSADNWTRVDLWTGSSNTSNSAIPDRICYLNGYFIVGGYQYDSSTSTSTAKIAFATAPNIVWSTRDLNSTVMTSVKTYGVNRVRDIAYVDGTYLFGGNCRNSSSASTGTHYDCLWTCDNLVSGLISEPLTGDMGSSQNYVEKIVVIDGEISLVSYRSGLHYVSASRRIEEIDEIFSSLSGGITVQSTGTFPKWLFTSFGYLIAVGCSNGSPIDTIITYADSKIDIHSSTKYAEYTVGSLINGWPLNISEAGDGLFISNQQKSSSTSSYRPAVQYLDMSIIHIPSISLSDGAYTFIKVRSE